MKSSGKVQSASFVFFDWWYNQKSNQKKAHSTCKFDQNPYENVSVFENYCQNRTVSNPNFITSVTGTALSVVLLTIMNKGSYQSLQYPLLAVWDHCDNHIWQVFHPQCAQIRYHHHHHHQISLIKSCHAQLNYKDVVTIKNRKIKIWIKGTKHNSTELSVTRWFSS